MADAAELIARPKPAKVWPWRSYRRHSALRGHRGHLDAVDLHGTAHRFEVASGPGSVTHLVPTVTSHVGARGSVWREQRLLAVRHGGGVVLSMRTDGYVADDLRRVAEAAGARYGPSHWFRSETERDAEYPPAPGCIWLDVATRRVKRALLASFVVVPSALVFGVIFLVTR